MIKKLSVVFMICVCFLISGCKITGSIQKDSEGLAGITVILTGDDTRSVVTKKDGSYTFGNMLNPVKAGSYKVTPLLPGIIYKAVKKGSHMADITSVDFLIESVMERQTEAGKIIGFKTDALTNAWIGIPFAEPPVGDLRWKAPRPKTAWGESETYHAMGVGSICPQIGGLLGGVPSSDYGKNLGEEDCLYLNIWAPENAPEKKELLPVMVWIHGGGNAVGHGSAYNGQKLSETHSLVVVTFNYRLGPFGWFTHPAMETGDPLDDSGNYGTLDIIRALTWVQDNIDEFGGDPSNVTIFGESAGARNTMSMLISGQASGLFHKAVAQSGGLGTEPFAYGQNYKDDPFHPGHFASSREVVNNLLMKDNIAENRDRAVLFQNSRSDQYINGYLYGKSTLEIMNAFTRDGVEMGMMPQLFRDGVVFPDEDPLVLLTNTDNYNAVPLITGANRDESKLFTIFNPHMVDMMFGIPVSAKDKSYYELYNYYSSTNIIIRAVDTVAQILSETSGQPGVYGYRFNWDEEPNLFGIDIPFLLGAAHGLEITFIFNDFDRFIAPEYTSLLFSNRNESGRMELAKSMSSYWAEFAYTGNPGKGRDGEEVEWTPWRNDGDKYIIFDTGEDGGIRMTPESIMSDMLYDQLLNETEFKTQEQHCGMYEDLYSRSPMWNEDDYTHLGGGGCGN